MKRRISSLATLVVVLLVLIVPMFAFTASAAEEATLSFASTAQRTSLSTSQQVWEQNGIIFTNNKASSTTAVADYSKPARLYAGSSVTIEAPGNITKIVFDCNSSSYATAMKNSIGSAATASSDKVTVTLDGTSDSYTVEKLTAQVRIDSLTVTYTTGSSPEPEPSCTHENTTVTTVDATCTKEGSTTVKCNDCGTTSTTSIPATGHVNTTTTTTDATCTEAGSTTVKCNDCGATVSTTSIPATGHNYVGDTCSSCGVTMQTYSYSFVTPTGTIKEGSTTGSVTMESAPTHAGFTFVGWSKTSLSTPSTTAPTLYQPETTLNITEDTTFYAVFSYTEVSEGDDEYVKTELTNIKPSDVVVVTMKNSAGVYAMSNNNGTSSAPSAVKVTVSGTKLTGDIGENVLWNISNNNGTLTFYVNGSTSTWLYCTSTNNGVRVGNNTNKTFTIDTSSGYLKHVGTSRYIGIYNSQDWRCYTSTTTNISDQTLAFYVLSTDITYYTSNPEAAECSHENVTETVTKEATCTEKGLISVVCDDCGSQLPEKEIPISHNLVDGICVKCNYTDTPTNTVDGTWTLVTDVADLREGDIIVIVANGEYNYALSTTQNTNNRGIASVAKNGNAITFGADVQRITLVAGTKDGTLAFQVGKDAYLYAASSGSNHLKTDSSITDNASWKITIDENGVATITAQGTNTRNTLKYNSNSSLFSCYAEENDQKDVVIYKLESSSENDTAEIYGASMTVGSTLAINYHVTNYIGSDYYMVFSMNGVNYTVDASTLKHGYLVFTFANIPPQMMGDTITAKLYKSDSDNVLDEVEISVKEYAEKVIALYPDNEKLMNLIADMLKYGAAAQEYIGYKASELVTDGIDLTGKGSTADPTTDDNHRSMTTEEGTEIDKSVYSFTAAGVRFDFDNKIYVKFKATGDANISLKCNGKYVAKEDLRNGTYIFYTDGIDAYSFDKVYTFELYVDNVPHQTLTYSVNSYAYAKFTDEQTTAVDELALALYRYGLSAKEYTGR